MKSLVALAQNQTNLISSSVNIEKVEVHTNLNLHNQGFVLDTLLFLAEGQNYTLSISENDTLQINNYFQMNSNGCFNNTLKSQVNGTKAYIKNLGDSAVFDFLNIQDIEVFGTSAMNAGVNSNDISNNTGWVWESNDWVTLTSVHYVCMFENVTLNLIPPNYPFGESFIWNTGSLDSGVVVTNPGTYWVEVTYGDNCTQADTFHVGEGASAGDIKLNFEEYQSQYWDVCQNWPSSLIPDIQTDVTIESGKTAIIRDTLLARAHHLDIQNGGTLILRGGILHIDSGITNNGTFIVDSGTVIVEGTDTTFFNGNAPFNFDKLEIDKTESSSIIKLNQDISISGDLTLNKGIILNSGSAFQFEDGATTSPGSQSSYIVGSVRKIGDDDFTFPIGKNGKWAPAQISALGSAMTIDAEYFTGTYADITLNASTMEKVSSQEYWEISRPAGAGNIDLTLFYPDANYSGISSGAPSDLCIAHFLSGQWESEGNESSTDSSITSSINSFSPFSFGRPIGGNNALPAELSNFSAEWEDNQQSKVRLNWATLSEIDNDFFTVYKSTDYTNWEEVSTVVGAGNSPTGNNYQTTDFSPYQQNTYYRLAQTDFNGKESFFDPQFLKYKTSQENNELNVYPNPCVEKVFLNTSGNTVEHIRIFDQIGKEFFIMPTQNNQGLEFDLVGLPPGVYYLEVDGETIRFLKSDQ
jgi:hypothetical protein